MQTQPQPQQANPTQATQAMLQQSKASQLQQGQQPQSSEQPQQQGGGQDNFDAEILQNLEAHLNGIDPKQKQFLAGALAHYANIVIPVLGIVCGQEVMDYFVNIYKQNFAKGAAQQQQQPPQQANSQQQNSTVMPQAQQPNQEAQQPPAQQPQM